MTLRKSIVLDEPNPHSRGRTLLFNKDYVAEFVYGGIDGAITTFAVVAGAEGANFSFIVVVILGVANLIADGFSMSVGNFFANKAERDTYKKYKATEYWEIENVREKEIEEIREIYAAKGFKGELLEQVVKVITADKEVWVDTMMKEELDMVNDGKTPLKTASVTFISFVVIGAIPLLSYLFGGTSPQKGDFFLYSCILTCISLAIIGGVKSTVTEQNILRGIAETVLLGGFAALLAYYVGDLLGRFFY